MSRLQIKITDMEFGAIKREPMPDTEEARIWDFIWHHRIWAIITKNGGQSYG